MPVCDQCGNDYPKAFQMIQAGRTWTFDSFECAIEATAPRCAHCNCRIIGHGVEQGETIFCCEHCLEHAEMKAQGGQQGGQAAHD